MKPSITQLMIGQLSRIPEILSPEAMDELIAFVTSSQNANGGFNNRNGDPDPYYSFFGLLVASALGLKPELEKLRNYILNATKSGQQSLADQCSLALIDALLNEQPRKRWAKAVHLVRNFLGEKNLGETSYNAFLLLLTLDALVGRPVVLISFVRRMIRRIHAEEAMPCSQVAALLVLKSELLIPCDAEKKLLSNYFKEGSGFKIYPSMDSADLLSTAVALFGLKFSGGDVRMYAPSAIRFVEEQFSNGAFLSGDGDETRDLEYTFYGMLALTSVA